MVVLLSKKGFVLLLGFLLLISIPLANSQVEEPSILPLPNVFSEEIIPLCQGQLKLSCNREPLGVRGPPDGKVYECGSELLLEACSQLFNPVGQQICQKAKECCALPCEKRKGKPGIRVEQDLKELLNVKKDWIDCDSLKKQAQLLGVGKASTAGILDLIAECCPVAEWKCDALTGEVIYTENNKVIKRYSAAQAKKVVVNEYNKASAAQKSQIQKAVNQCWPCVGTGLPKPRFPARRVRGLPKPPPSFPALRAHFVGKNKNKCVRYNPIKNVWEFQSQQLLKQWPGFVKPRSYPNPCCDPKTCMPRTIPCGCCAMMGVSCRAS